jgi:hypothetical protein
MFRRFLGKTFVNFLLPEFVRDARYIECKLALLESLKVAYMQLTTYKSKESLPFKNALLTAIASNGVGPS